MVFAKYHFFLIFLRDEMQSGIVKYLKEISSIFIRPSKTK